MLIYIVESGMVSERNSNINSELTVIPFFLKLSNESSKYFEESNLFEADVHNPRLWTKYPNSAIFADFPQRGKFLTLIYCYARSL